MAEKLTFTSVQLLSFSRGAKGGSATFSSSLNSTIQKKLSWTDIPECIVGGKLEGDLAATVITLTPKEPELRKHEFSLDCQRISGFQSVRLELEASKGKGHRTEIRFTVTFADPVGCRKLEAYMLTCGKSTMAVSYEKAAVQEEIPEVVATDEQRQAAMEIN